ncbi:hypothetical protein PanWU01x14_301900 [Parasponia andersonii]|uniref:Uncharacterized protein n=1 Tax=Parasponia andersonii TaxID=3476 RepID=A0A2P5ATH0_PARAD|nr:hypothetical protein PanWU01x14_301900 [Parasponia andersonii]
MKKKKEEVGDEPWVRCHARATSEWAVRRSLLSFFGPKFVSDLGFQKLLNLTHTPLTRFSPSPHHSTPLPLSSDWCDTRHAWQHDEGDFVISKDVV